MKNPYRNKVAYGCVSTFNDDQHVEIGYSAYNARKKIEQWLYNKGRPKNAHSRAKRLTFTYGYYLENRDNPLFWYGLIHMIGNIPHATTPLYDDLTQRIASGSFKKTLKHHYTHKYRKMLT